MGHKNLVLGHFDNFLCNFIKLRGIVNHAVCNAGELLDVIRNFLLGINERTKLINNLPAVVYQNGNLGNFTIQIACSRSFDINYCVHFFPLIIF